MAIISGLHDDEWLSYIDSNVSGFNLHQTDALDPANITSGAIEVGSAPTPGDINGYGYSQSG